MSQKMGLSFEEMIAYGMIAPRVGGWGFGSLGGVSNDVADHPTSEVVPAVAQGSYAKAPLPLNYFPAVSSASHGSGHVRPKHSTLNKRSVEHSTALDPPAVSSPFANDEHEYDQRYFFHSSGREAALVPPMLLASDTDGSGRNERTHSDEPSLPEVAQFGPIIVPRAPMPMPLPPGSRPMPAPTPAPTPVPQPLPPGGRPSLPPDIQGPYMPQVPYPEGQTPPTTGPAEQPDGGGNRGNDNGSATDEGDEARRDKRYVFRSAEDILSRLNFRPTISPQAQEMADYADEAKENLRKKVKNGEDPMRIFNKGYLLTRFSMQRGKVSTEYFRGKGLDIPPGMTHIYPEDAMGAYMLSPAGTALLDKLEKGESPSLEQVQHIVDVMRPFGRQNALANDIFDAVTITQQKRKEFTDIIKMDASSAVLERFVKTLPGIGEGKSGYLMFYLGDGSKAAFDSRNRKVTTEKVKWKTPANEPRFTRGEIEQPSGRIFPQYHLRLEQLNRPVRPWQRRNLHGIVGQEIWELGPDGDHHLPHPEDQRIRLRAMRWAQLDPRLYGPAVRYPGSLPSDIVHAVA